MVLSTVATAILCPFFTFYTRYTIYEFTKLSNSAPHVLRDCYDKSHFKCMEKQWILYLDKVYLVEDGKNSSFGVAACIASMLACRHYYEVSQHLVRLVAASAASARSHRQIASEERPFATWSARGRKDANAPHGWTCDVQDQPVAG